MSATPIEANVVLTADNSGYDTSMDQSAQSTDKLAKSIDSLGAKINQLTKSAGRKMLGITAADVALITGATAAWASYEKQVSRLQAQAAVVNRTREGETRTMKSYADSIKNLRSEYGTTTAEAAALTQQVSKLADQTTSIKNLTTTFVEMSHATGESSTGLANSLLSLQKIMGAPQSQTRNYANELTYLAAKSNTSATALAEFSSQIAPMGRAMGMSTKEVIGFSNMFAKAGQDGYTAATAFNKVTQDILQATQTGSPDLLKYANLLGVTVGQFKEMGGQQQVAGFLDQIAKLGPRAAMELNRFGFDGVRMAKAITGTVQASGGAMNALNEANIGFNSDSVDKGSKAAENMSTTLAKMRQDLQQTAESFGKAFGPGIDFTLRQVEKLASGFQTLMDGPLGKFIKVAATVVIPVTAAAGALLLLSGTILKVAAAFAVLRGSPGLGVLEGMRGGARMIPEMDDAGMATGNFVAAGGAGAMLGKRGAQIAEGGTWLQRGTYNAGQALGSGARSSWGFLNSLGRGEPGMPNIWQRGAAGGIRMGSDIFTSQLDAMRYANPADRSQFFGRYFMGRGPEMEGAVDRTNTAREGLRRAQGVHDVMKGAVDEGKLSPEHAEASQKALDAARKEAEAADKAEKSILAMAEAQQAAAKITTNSAREQMGVYRTLRAEGMNVARAFSEAAVGAGKFALQTGLKAGGSILSAIGPMNLALMGATMIPIILPLIQKMFGWGGSDKKPYEYQAYAGNPYLQAAGATQPTGYTPELSTSENRNLNRFTARAVDQRSITAAAAPGHTLVNKTLYGMNEEQATTFLGADYDLTKRNPQALQAMKLDLIDKFGPSTADRIMSNLDSGTYGSSADVFYQTGNINAGLQFGQVQANQAYGARGARGGRQARATAISGALRAAFQPGADVGAFTEGLNKTYGLDLSEDTMKRLANEVARPGQAVTDEEPGGFWTRGPITGIKNLIPGVDHAENEQDRMARITRTRDALMGTNKERLGAVLGAQGPEATATMLGKLGLDQTLTGDSALTAIMKAMRDQGGRPPTEAAKALEFQVAQQGPAGRMFVSSPEMQKALSFGGQNTAANVKAINTMMDKMQSAGMTAPQITKAMGDIQSRFDPSDPHYILAGMVSGQSEQELALQLPNMTRAQGFQAQVDQFQAISAIKPTSDEQYQKQQDAKVAMAQAMTEQEQYFKQMLIMQDQYEISRRRAQEDYNQQRGYQQHDYELSRSRAEASFNRQRAYATADYYRGVKRATYDFNLSRRHEEEDFNRSVANQARQMASTVYDIYHRVQVQRTESATMLMANAGDQLKRMREQAQDLDKLRGMGMTNLAINQLGLNKPENQQQLARYIGEATPQMIESMNKVAGSLRVKAAKDLMEDPANLDWQEALKERNIGLRRNREQFHRQMELGHEDFVRGMKRQSKEFNISLDQQATDYQTSMDRQEEAYKKTMHRAAVDLANIGKEMDLTYEQTLKRSTDRLTGHAKDQADAALQSFKDLKGKVVPEAYDLMKSLGKIFGFKVAVPEGLGHYLALQDRPEAPIGTPPGRHPGVQPGMHQGGVVPGWTPGRDTQMVPLSGGEAIMRPEWARAMGAGYIAAANHAAKHGGFADGGLVNPDSRVYMDGEPVSKITKAQLLLAEKLSRINFTTMQGSWQPYTSYSGSSHMGPGVVDESPGNFTTQYWLRRVGFAAWGRNFPGAATAGSGAHVHAVSLLDPGAAHQGQVAAYYAGQDGLGGRDYGPNPGMLPGLRGMLAQFSTLALMQDQVRGATGGGPAAIPSLRSVLKSFYPASEKAAFDMQGVHPLGPGQISHIMNKMVRKRYAESLEGVDPNRKQSWYGDGAVFGSPSTIGVGESGPEAVIPLNDAGVAFMAKAIHGAAARGVGLGSSPMGGGMSVYNTRIDRSTNFTGPITVQANDPGELLAKLQARQRVMALSRPALTGSAA